MCISRHSPYLRSEMLHSGFGSSCSSPLAAGDPSRNARVFEYMLKSEVGLIDAVVSLYVMLRAFLEQASDTLRMVYATYCVQACSVSMLLCEVIRVSNVSSIHGDHAP